MTSNIELALMSGASYESTRDKINRFPVPANWTSAKHETQNSGFEAVAFVREGTTIATASEIVISYAGTDPGDLSGDIAADLALAAGIISDQLRQAADYYLQVRAANPSATITFTGHSLGGGLAALMAVLFGESAYTFDQAPFLQSAQIFVDTDADGNQTSRSVAQRLSAYLTGRTTDTSALAKLDAFIAANDPLNTTAPNQADTLAVRGGRVTNINVDGEFLTSWPVVPTSNRIGSQADIVNSHDGLGLLGGIGLHAIELLTAFLQSDPTAATNTDPQTESLNRVTYKLPDLLKMILDKDLFAYDRGTGNKDNEDFLTRIVRHQAGTSGSSSSDAMVERFTADLWRLAQDGGMTLTDGNENDASAHKVSNALIAFAMQYYYEDTDNAKDSGRKLFTDAGSNGIRFDLRDVSTDIATAIDQMNAGGDDVNLAVKKDGKYLLKGFKDFEAYLNSGAFTPEELTQINAFLPTLRDWTIQAGAGGMTATDTQNRGAFMLGGNGADTLTGGSADDLLVGNAGADTLAGDAGNDILLGGTGNDLLKGGEGNDTYVFTGSYGIDLITDSDGAGTIKVDGQAVSSATLNFESIYIDAASGQTVVKLNGGNSLVILKEGTNNRALVTDWSAARNLGITLQDTTPVVPTATLTGDFVKANDGTYYVMNGDNYAKAGIQANALDLISGTAGNDVIDGLGGDDALSGRDGDDWIEGGDGNDEIQGGLGKDTLNGGIGDDAIYGSSDMAIVKPTRVDFIKPVNTYPNPQATGFNWITGYYGTYGNGVPQSYSDAPRNRLADDQGNIIDGGAGNGISDANSWLLRCTGKKGQKQNLTVWTTPTTDAANAPYFTQTRRAA